VFPADLDPGQTIFPGESEPALVANLSLLLREDSWLAAAVLPGDGPDIPDGEFARFPCNGLAVSPDCPLAAHSARQRLFSLPTDRERRLATPRFVLRTYFATLPACCRLALSRLRLAPRGDAVRGRQEQTDGKADALRVPTPRRSVFRVSQNISTASSGAGSHPSSPGART
jgi:hypothetical protein